MANARQTRQECRIRDDGGMPHGLQSAQTAMAQVVEVWTRESAANKPKKDGVRNLGQRPGRPAEDRYIAARNAYNGKKDTYTHTRVPGTQLTGTSPFPFTLSARIAAVVFWRRASSRLTVVHSR